MPVCWSSRVLALSCVVALAATFLPQAAEAQTGAPFASVYTNHDFQTCPEQRSPHPDVVDIRRCRGWAGVPVVWTNEPDASWVDFGGRGGEGAVPGLDSFHAARGTIEWRGPSGARGVRPLAAIVRYDTGPSIRLGSSRLVVYRLRPDGACVMGVVRAGPNANAAARALVDRAAADFVCGRSRVNLGPQGAAMRG